MPKVYYKLKEIANELHVSESLIRFWEKELKLSLPSKEGRNNIRKYTSKHFEQFKLIKKLLREDEYTLKGVKKVLQKNNSSNCTQKLKELKEVKDLLINIKNILQKSIPADR